MKFCKTLIQIKFEAGNLANQSNMTSTQQDNQNDRQQQAPGDHLQIRSNVLSSNPYARQNIQNCAQQPNRLHYHSYNSKNQGFGRGSKIKQQSWQRRKKLTKSIQLEFR
ncbi:hypothetical protein OXYTRIMIC_074 [Oxytricha trifallax]|uniref:Uncharacterized protein n=1 Tax=Oxytricha trifallax TaxID=1172189 RepID=A0A073HZ39_9SPIT|nr:hypothetical protein OXYTRIMIC_074 [Oxytricha trifallax]